MSPIPPIEYAPTVLTATVVGTGALVLTGLGTLSWWATRQLGAMRALSAATNQAVVRRGRDGRWRMAVGLNPALHGDWPTDGFAPPELWRLRCHDDDRDALEAWLADLAPAAPLRFRLNREDGEQILEARRERLPHGSEELLVWRDLTASERLATRVRRHEQVQRAIIDNLADIAVFVQPLGGGAYTALCLPQRFTDLFTAPPQGTEPLPPFVPAMSQAAAELRERVLATPTHSAAFDREIAGRQVRVLGTLLGDGALDDADLLLVVRDLGPDARRVNRLETAAFLSGGVVHDLNNVLNLLVMHAELGREHVSTPAQAAQHFERISAACQRATELTGLMRRYLRRDTNDATPTQPILVGAAVEEAVSLLRPSIGHGVRVLLDLDHEVAIAGEGVHLHQVLSNLLLNAAQALAGRPSPCIRVRVSRTTDLVDVAGMVELVVEDNGPGMPPAVRERCFEPFFTTKPAGEGTGLGLAVVHGIVTEVLGGTITVDDAPGGGARFVLRLPAAAAGAPPRPLQPRAERTLSTSAA